MRDRLFIIIAGAVGGLLAVILVLLGNPADMGCFLLILLVAAPAFIFFSQEGPGSMAAPRAFY